MFLMLRGFFLVLFCFFLFVFFFSFSFLSLGFLNRMEGGASHLATPTVRFIKGGYLREALFYQSMTATSCI